MQAIILAAGMGARLGELTANNTKGMVEVNGVRLIERMLSQIEARNFKKIVIVTGYERRSLEDFVLSLGLSTPIEFINNPKYDRTNNIYSLGLAQSRLCEDDTVLFESDLIFEDAVLDALLEDPRATLALVDRYESWMDGTVVELDKADNIVNFVPGKNIDYTRTQRYFKTVNIYKFSRSFARTLYVPFLNAYIHALGVNEYYEQVLSVISLLDQPIIQAKRLDGQKWYEIDDVQDLDIAASIFHPDPHIRKSLIDARYGGFWRYPKMLDFCYLVNPFFPPERMKEEIKANLEALLEAYPSGMAVNSLVAARNFHVRPEQIVVGNGAAELIKALMDEVEGPCGVVRPTFEEYCNRSTCEMLEFWPQNPDFSYTAEDLMEYFEDENGGVRISSLILINPDNPSGNFIPPEGIVKLIQWAQKHSVMLVLDESFVDFADGTDNSLIRQDVVDASPHLVIVKSISKSYGVAGLRLGVLVCSDRELILKIKKSVAIWNINSLAEFYMQIQEKYRDEYTCALERIKNVRTQLSESLNELSFLRPIPSQANFITCEVLEPYTSSELATLCLESDFIIKDLSSKLGVCGRQYIRLAVRSEEENERLLEFLRNAEPVF